MARRHEALYHLQQGKSPQEIGRAMAIDTWRVFNHLFTLVGEGKILRSDLAFAISERIRGEVDSICKRRHEKGKTVTYEYLRDTLYRRGYKGDERLEAITYWRNLKDLEVALGDMHVWIARIEIFLHVYIKSVLQAKHSDQWWREISEPIRKKCATRLEEDPDPASESYAYTTLIEIKDILDKKWGLFQGLLPAPVRKEKKRLMDGLASLNTIRNRVMHPCKRVAITQENFSFVHGFLAFLRLSQWKSKAPADGKAAESNEQAAD
jgi:hypothetical protein